MKPDVKQDWTDKLRETMSDYQEQPSEKVWTGISRGAGLSGRSSVPVWLWGSCAAAALATGIFFAFDAADNKGSNLTADNIDILPAEDNHKATIQYDDLDETAAQTIESSSGIEAIEGNSAKAKSETIVQGSASPETSTSGSATTETPTQNTKIVNNNTEGVSSKNAGVTAHKGSEAAEEVDNQEVTGNHKVAEESENISGTSAEAQKSDSEEQGYNSKDKSEEQSANENEKTHLAGATSDGQNTDSTDGAEDQSAYDNENTHLANVESEGQTNLANVESEGQTQIVNAESDELTEEESEADAWRRYLSENPEKTKKKRGIFSASILANGAGEATGREKIRMSGVLGSNPLEPDAATGWVDPEFSENGTEMLADNVPEIDMEYIHKMPVKIGVAVRYDIGKRFGIETGISYAILNSDIKRGKNLSTWSKGEQTFNYIGIPLNLSFDIFSSRYVDFYVSAGGMMEKAVRGRINLDNYTNGEYVNSTKRSIKPKELEWSTNAAVGVQCNILPQLGIFVEPGINYHFKSNAQVKTIYTDKPTNFSIGFGLRWTFLD